VVDVGVVLEYDNSKGNFGVKYKNLRNVGSFDQIDLIFIYISAQHCECYVTGG
jgi:uncharacterized protein YkuJ